MPRTVILVTPISRTFMFLLLLNIFGFGSGTAGVGGEKLVTKYTGITSETTQVQHPNMTSLNNRLLSVKSPSTNVSDFLNLSMKNKTEQHGGTIPVPEEQVEFSALTQLVIRLAQCRANCLDKFGVGESLTSLQLSLQSKSQSVLSNCWNTCRLLEEDGVPDPRGNGAQHSSPSPCSPNAKCLIGCQEACGFHLHQPENILKSSNTPNVALPVEPLLQIQSQNESQNESQDLRNQFLITWPSITNQSQGFLVYSLVKLHHAETSSSWELVTEQTITNHFSISLEQGTLTSDFRILAVNSNVLLHVYCCPSPNNDYKRKVADRWHFRVSSLVHQKFLVVTEVRWELSYQKEGTEISGYDATGQMNKRLNVNVTRPDEAVNSSADLQPQTSLTFLLTWEVYGGLVRGHLVTENNVVTISLWPDTSYTLQVGLIDETEVKVEKGESIMTKLERILSSGGELPVRSKSSFLDINTTQATYPLVKKSVQERKRSTEEEPRHHDPNNTRNHGPILENGKFLGERSRSGSSHFCSWNLHQLQHPSPTEDEVRSCMLIWAILIICLLLIFLMFLYFSVAVYLAMKKQIYFQKLHRTCSVSSIYSRQIYRLRKSIFRKNHYRHSIHNLKAPLTSSSLELLPFSDSSNSNSSASEGEELE